MNRKYSLEDHDELPKRIGLKNDVKENNCFLNCALQALWQFECFRTALLGCKIPCEDLANHRCIACSVKKLFEDLSLKQFVGEGPVNPLEVREALASAYLAQDRFQEGQTADAIEALTAILNGVHSSFIKDSSQGLEINASNRACVEKCPAHRVFEVVINEKLICSCGEEIQKAWDYGIFLHSFYTTEILEQFPKRAYSLIESARRVEDLLENQDHSVVLPIISKLPNFMRDSWAKNYESICSRDSDTCKFKRSRRILELKSVPEIMLISLLWKESTPQALEITQIMASLPIKLQMNEIFATLNDDDFMLRGMIMYGCGHYVLYFIDTEEVSWYKYDDSYIRKIGTGKLKDAIDEMIKYRYAPVGVFYEKSTNWNLIQCCEVSKKEWLVLENKALKSDELRDYLNTETSSTSSYSSLSSGRYSYLDRYKHTDSSPSTSSSVTEAKTRTSISKPPKLVEYSEPRITCSNESVCDEPKTNAPIASGYSYRFYDERNRDTRQSKDLNSATKLGMYNKIGDTSIKETKPPDKHEPTISTKLSSDFKILDKYYATTKHIISKSIQDMQYPEKKPVSAFYHTTHDRFHYTPLESPTKPITTTQSQRFHLDPTLSSQSKVSDRRYISSPYQSDQARLSLNTVETPSKAQITQSHRLKSPYSNISSPSYEKPRRPVSASKYPSTEAVQKSWTCEYCRNLNANSASRCKCGLSREIASKQKSLPNSSLITRGKANPSSSNIRSTSAVRRSWY